jgi:hypothetical protein
MSSLTPLGAITLDPELQLRATIDRAVLENYAQLLVDGATFPPVTVFDTGQQLLRADGFHRWHAHSALQMDSIGVEGCTQNQIHQHRPSAKKPSSKSHVPGAYQPCTHSTGTSRRIPLYNAFPLAQERSMRWQDRIDHYVKETGFPEGLFVGSDGRVVGSWIMGNDYRVRSAHYGGYPAGYLRRIKALFPDKQRVLHLFSGQVDLETFPGDTVDINPSLNPTYVDDAQTLTKVPVKQYDLVLADPPYSVEDTDHYQTTMVKRNVVMRALQRLPIDAHVVWLDQVLPMYRKETFELEGAIGMWKSINHRFRGITIFRRRLAPRITVN